MMNTGGHLSVLNLTVLVGVGIPGFVLQAVSLAEGQPARNRTGRLQTHDQSGDNPDYRPWIRYRNKEEIQKSHHHAKCITNHDATNLVGHVIQHPAYSRHHYSQDRDV